MKTFTYTYRDPAGALKKATVDAADRTDALRQIKTLNFVVVSVAEGGSAGAAKKRFSSKAVLGVAAAALGGLLLLLCLVKNPTGFQSKHPVSRSEALPTKRSGVAQHGGGSEKKRGTPPSKPVSAISRQPVPSDKPAVARLPGPALPQGTQAPAAALLGETNAVVEVPDQFKTASLMEIHLAMLASTPPGEEPLPLPFLDVDGAETNYEEDAVAGLQHTIEVNENDDENLQRHKEDVAWAKEDVRQFVLSGQGSTASYIHQLQDRMKETAQTRADVAAALKEMAKSSSKEAVQKELDAANKAFEESGVPAVEADEVFGE